MWGFGLGRGRPGAPVHPGAARGWAWLVLVAASVDGGAVGVLGRRTQPEDAELADLHPGPEHDRQVRDVAQLQRDVAGEARVDEARRRVGQQPEAAEARLALQPAGEPVTQR